ncbi:hypothetical protein [Candidatus Odyssella thessalonicensis]|uniref:hypothetical protein n=1 Tax=Candidatus Odyssella thessalonicensis TaxID=84647 RepID=UPI000225B211|nr:hypothetical protein [Candidatus Odyssella thessalonicensis]
MNNHLKYFVSVLALASVLLSIVKASDAEKMDLQAEQQDSPTNNTMGLVNSPNATSADSARRKSFRIYPRIPPSLKL